MNKITIFILVTIVYILVEIEALPNDFWENIKSGWNKFLSSIRRPVRIRRLGKLGKLKSTTENTTITETTSLPPTFIQRALDTSTTMKITEISKTLRPMVTSNEIMKKQTKTETSSVAKQSNINISSAEADVLRIPVISLPTWQSVYQWNNLQKPPNIYYRRKNVRDPRVSFL